MDAEQILVELAEGVYVENDVLNIVEKLYNYDPNLRVKYVDPRLAEFGDAPYRITEVCKDGIERVVFDVWNLDDRILDRLYRADTQHHNILASLDSQNQRIRSEQNRRYREEMDEARDIVEHVLKSPKGRYSFKNPSNETVTLDDDPRVRYKKK